MTQWASGLHKRPPTDAREPPSGACHSRGTPLTVAPTLRDVSHPPQARDAARSIPKQGLKADRSHSTSLSGTKCKKSLRWRWLPVCRRGRWQAGSGAV